MALVPSTVKAPYSPYVDLPRAVNPYLDAGYSFEDIAQLTGLSVDDIRSYTDASRPGYGVGSPSAPSGGGEGGGGGGGSVSDSEAMRLAAENAQRSALKGEIGSYQDDIDNLYAQLFSDLDTLVKERKGELDTQYGDQFTKASESFTGAIPEIETSYAALGAADSTDKSDAKTKAKKGFDDTTATIGKNKSDDETALGKYATETKTKFETDKNSAKTNISRAATTDDVDALRGMRNDIETNLSTGANTKATLGTDAGAKGILKTMTADGGRYEAAIGALDEIINSSMSGAVKEASIKAIKDNAGLSEEDKKKVDQQYGNVYSEQAAL